MEVEDCDTDGSFLEAVQPASKRIAALVQKRPKNFELFIIQSPLIPNKIITSVVGVLQKFVIIVADKGRIDWARHEWARPKTRTKDNRSENILFPATKTPPIRFI